MSPSFEEGFCALETITLDPPLVSLPEAVSLVAAHGSTTLRAIIAVGGGIVAGTAGSYTAQIAMMLFC